MKHGPCLGPRIHDLNAHDLCFYFVARHDDVVTAPVQDKQDLPVRGAATPDERSEPAGVPDGLIHKNGADRARMAASKYGLFGLWAIVIAIFGILEPRTFLTAQNFENMFNSQAALLILAFALLPTLIAGELDLSVAGTMTIASTLTGQPRGPQ